MFKLPTFAAAVVALLLSTGVDACVPPLVQFAYGSARVPTKGQDDIALVLERARAAPLMKIKLTATSDGSKPNAKMSRRRVEAIKAILARGGVTSDRVDVEYVSAVSDFSARTVMMEVVSAPTCGA